MSCTAVVTIAPSTRILGAASLLFLATCLAATTAHAACVGDCNTDGKVTLRELVLGAERVVGKARNCPSADADNNSAVTVDEMVIAVANGQNSCAGIVTATPTFTRTPRQTSTPTRTPTPISVGPVITAFGLARADNFIIQPSDSASDGTPIYARQIGAGFIVYLEAIPGSSGAPVGNRTLPNGDPRPDLQIIASRDLGNGSSAVCDDGPLPDFPLGGVPGIDPANFDPESLQITNALVDLACRFSDNTGDWCTTDDTENPNPITPTEIGSVTQFCTKGVVGVALHFPSGDTTLTAQVRDFDNNIGSTARIIIRTP